VSKDRLQVLWFALYDWANSSFTTLVVTFIYAAYYTKAIAPDEITGTALWSRGITATALIVALTSPVLGALADQGGRRRLVLAVNTLLCVAAAAALAFVRPGQIYAGLALFVIGNVAFELGMVFYNSFLPDIAPREKIGRVSGFAWGLGYAGGLVCLELALVGFVSPDKPWFGISREAGANIRATNLLAAAWYLVFALPFLLFVREQRKERMQLRGLVGRSFRRLTVTFGQLRRYRQTLRFLVARLIYNDGLVTIFSFGGIYAAGTFGMNFSQIILFGIALNVAAGLGAFAFGYLDDRVGARTTVLVSLAALIAAVAVAVSTHSTAWFWAAAIAIGVFVGPNQSASRSMMGRFAPPERQAEFFGFYAFSGKFSSFLGPLLLGIVTQATGSQRWGMSTLILFFIAGGLILLGVDEEEGKRAALDPAGERVRCPEDTAG
jgi:MFS transporter, UMF1 family